ncbi:hypothetical protein Drose_05805 [Dactylosporangium roseum]|uniref:Uncharacterized protein n=1 Tax=Dactylosporangium roseum TaxID=47989 RepID=A0ABY5Z9X0_9ACTN|nr:hypothetical protein [Dactylosporangium roseum]UWZ37785.1 hypothetical protein Drose_05805 [Dactylosporangium roseum]
MTTFWLLVAALASFGSAAAGVAFCLKKLRKAWIPPSLLAAWIGSSFVAAVVHLGLENLVRATIGAATLFCAIAAAALHQASREHV